MLQHVLSAYGFNPATTTIESTGNGLINRTWKLVANEEAYILQLINDAVFKKPADIAHNIHEVSIYLAQNSPQYLFISPLATTSGLEIFFVEEEGWYRLFPFVKNSHSLDVVENTQQAFEAAKQFGLFTKMLAGFDAASLKITLPHFHDLSLRYFQFEQALKKGNQKRIAESGNIIHYLQQQKNIVDEFETIKTNPAFKIRVTHHDTKISNVLFDDGGNGICVIDLDTVMPGYFISDVGDMLRTYLSAVSEEETDFEKIEIRDDFYKAIKAGYLLNMQDELSRDEKNAFFYAGKFMIYMQALRFITDYFNDDVYYGAKYDKHNFNRAANQMVLLQRIMEKEKKLY